MKQRDKAILDDLNRFRCLTRDDIIHFHFNQLKQPVTGCNTVMKRLRRDGHVKAATERNQFVYLSADRNMKSDSAKIPHFLKIVDFYKQLCQHEKPRIFNVEPKFGEKGTVEPDVFMIWRKAPFFVEVQNSIYSEKQFKEKMDRYDSFYESGIWRSEPWQPREKKFFPHIWIVTDNFYNIEKKPYSVIQSRNVSEFLEKLS